jgi:hypothetical protein
VSRGQRDRSPQPYSGFSRPNLISELGKIRIAVQLKGSVLLPYARKSTAGNIM